MLVLGSDFETKDGPDLKLVLSPSVLDRVEAKTALKNSLVLGPLERPWRESVSGPGGHGPLQVPLRADPLRAVQQAVGRHCDPIG